jgi:hypothetical protein
LGEGEKEPTRKTQAVVCGGAFERVRAGKARAMTSQNVLTITLLFFFLGEEGEEGEEGGNSTSHRRPKAYETESREKKRKRISDHDRIQRSWRGTDSLLEKSIHPQRTLPHQPPAFSSPPPLSLFGSYLVPTPPPPSRTARYSCGKKKKHNRRTTPARVHSEPRPESLTSLSPSFFRSTGRLSHLPTLFPLLPLLHLLS